MQVFAHQKDAVGLALIVNKCLLSPEAMNVTHVVMKKYAVFTHNKTGAFKPVFDA